MIINQVRAKKFVIIFKGSCTYLRVKCVIRICLLLWQRGDLAIYYKLMENESTATRGIVEIDFSVSRWELGPLCTLVEFCSSHLVLATPTMVS